MKVFFSVGETSGDTHAANLIAELLKLAPHAQIRGLGGERMAAAGMQLDHNTVHKAVMFLQSLKRIPELRGIFRETVEILRSDRPDVVVLCDSVGFNLPVAKAAHGLGIPVVYYISPQIWAHGAWRVKKIRRWVDKVLVIYPFEVDFYQRHGVEAAYVGHPLFDELVHKPLDEAAVARCKPAEGKRMVSILPGSRKQEIEHLLPILIGAARAIESEVGDVQFCIACAGPEHEERIRRIMAREGVEYHYEIGLASEVIAASDLSLCTSGTATLQVAYFAKPMVIIYYVNPLFYFFARPFVRTPWIGLANVLAGKEVAPEHILTQPRSDGIAASAIQFLQDPALYAQAVADLEALRGRVAQPGASANAAREIVEFVASRS